MHLHLNLRCVIDNAQEKKLKYCSLKQIPQTCPADQNPVLVDEQMNGLKGRWDTDIRHYVTVHGHYGEQQIYESQRPQILSTGRGQTKLHAQNGIFFTVSFFYLLCM